MNTCIYPGSFDPPTNGHLYVLDRCVDLFDQTIILIGINPNKKDFLSVEEKISVWNEILINRSHLNGRVRVNSSSQYTVHWAKDNGASEIVRGIRGNIDLEYETALQTINKTIEPWIDTIFIIPPPEISYISSSVIRSLIGIPGWENPVRKYVPEEVFLVLENKFGRNIYE